jgi:hypothetical protein
MDFNELLRRYFMTCACVLLSGRLHGFSVVYPSFVFFVLGAKNKQSGTHRLSVKKAMGPLPFRLAQVRQEITRHCTVHISKSK